MENYRKHWLINSIGERYDFTNIDFKVFLNDPAGFGFRRTYSSMTVGNSEIVTASQFQLTDLTGDLLFYDSTIASKYEQYQRFIQFCKYKPLEFHYQTPNDNQSYYAEVLFTQATKGEVSRDGVLHIGVTFHRLTQWLNDVSTIYVMDNSPINKGKYHDLEYNYAYAGTNLSNTKIINLGTDDVGFLIKVKGREENGVITETFSNMRFTLSQNGEEYGICQINGEYNLAVIDSVEKTESIYLERNGASIVMPEQYQDFTVANGHAYLTWIKLKVGESIFNFKCDDTENFGGTVTLQFKNSYASV